MPDTRPTAMDFLKTRRSCPARTLTTPVPDRATLRELLEVAARVPDHGKLEPWRFVVLERPALARLADLAAQRGEGLGIAPEKRDKGVAQYADASLVVVVVASPEPSEAIPAVEQTLSAGAVCLTLLNAALASGWGACWLTGWAAHDRTFAEEGLGLTAQEFVAGMIHIGTATRVPPERPRPDVAALTTWRDA